jgi:hypothetical protein
MADVRSDSRRHTEDWRTLPWKKFQRDVFRLQKRIYQASQVGAYERGPRAEEPCDGKLCAVSRTERIANEVGRSSG